MPISTLLVADAWELALASHPDRVYARYICDGICHGFRTGFTRGSLLKSVSANMESARQHHPNIITEYLQNKLSLGRMLGPFKETDDLPSLQVNWFGVIPKGHNSGRWRLITDLSYPPGQSVNDGIDPALCSMAYTTVNDVAAIVTQLGRGALMAKVDIESAYRLVPVHPQDRPLLAMRWEGHIYVDPMHGMKPSAAGLQRVRATTLVQSRNIIVIHLSPWCGPTILNANWAGLSEKPWEYLRSCIVREF